jgi:lipoprotein
MRCRFVWFCCLALGVLLSACHAPVQPTVRVAEGVRVEGQDSLGWNFTIGLSADNPNPKPLKVSKAKFDVWLNSTSLGSLELLDPVTLPPGNSQNLQVRVRLKLRTQADGLRLMLSADQNLLEAIEVQGKVRGHYGGIRKTVKVPRQPLEQLLKNSF